MFDGSARVYLMATGDAVSGGLHLVFVIVFLVGIDSGVFGAFHYVVQFLVTFVEFLKNLTDFELLFANLIQSCSKKEKRKKVTRNLFFEQTRY